MPTVIIRDDDISFFTSPGQLERIYGRLWSAGLPVCLSVIPDQFADTRVYWRHGNPHDPGIPPAYRGQAQCYAVADNRELCAFLNELADAGLVEICLHGYTHTFFEFITHDRALIQRKLTAGLDMLRRAMPAAQVKTFVPPYDRVSPGALEALKAQGFHICTQSRNLAPMRDWPQLNGFAAGSLGRGQALFVCDDYLFTHKREPADSLQLARAALHENALSIVCNHYWMFDYPWREEPNREFMAAWDAWLDELLATNDCRVTTFSGYAALNEGR